MINRYQITLLYLFITIHNKALTVSKHLSSYAPPTIKAQT